MDNQPPDIEIEKALLNEYRESKDVRSHDLYVNQDNWTNAGVTDVDNLFVADLSNTSEDSLKIGPISDNERVRIDLDGVSEECDAFEKGHNICLSIGLTEQMANYLQEQLQEALNSDS